MVGLSIIVTISEQFKKGWRPFLTALFLGIVVFGNQSRIFGSPNLAQGGVLGGPANVSPRLAVDYGTMLRSQPVLGSAQLNSFRNETQPFNRLAFLENGLLVAQDDASTFAGGGTLVGYTVKKGDSLSKIAANFGISTQTIIGLNPEVKNRAIRVGQELQILPVSGVLYVARDGETIESVADAFNVSVAQLREFNKNMDLATLKGGMTVVIPGASAKETTTVVGGKTVPDLKGFFVMPTEGFNWAKLHNYNAVDIANACGTPVRAAAEGLVVDASNDEWSEGYGKYVMIEHPNGVRTRYAHMKAIAVSVGDYVKQSEEVGKMGDTGEATGCHLHFEVYGAKNPFTKL